MAREAAVAVESLNVTGAIDDRHAVVAVLAKVPVDGHVLPGDIETVGVEREAL